MGQALRLRRRHPRAGRRRDRARGGVDERGRRRRGAGRGGRPRPGLPGRRPRHWARAGVSGPNRTRPTPGGPGPVGRREQGALPGRRAPAARTRAGDGALAGGRAGHLGHRRAGAAGPPDRGDPRWCPCACCGPTASGGPRWWSTSRWTGVPMSVAGTHMAHLPFGSHRNWAELRRQLRTEARPDAVLAGRHEHLGPAGPPVHAGLAPGRDGRDLARLAPPQPDRPHPRARRACARSRARCSPTPARTTGPCGPSWRSVPHRTAAPVPPSGNEPDRGAIGARGGRLV